MTDNTAIPGIVPGQIAEDLMRWHGEATAALNTSGFNPLDKRVLVLPDAVKEKVGSILLPDQIKEQDRWAQQKGTLVAVGETAWSEAVDDARRHGAHFTPPEPGARILYGKYSGVLVDGDDGREYRLMNDDDIVARLADG